MATPKPGAQPYPLGGSEDRHHRHQRDGESHAIENVHLEQIRPGALSKGEGPKLQAKQEGQRKQITSASQRRTPASQRHSRPGARGRSIRNESVMPVRTKKIAGPMPPKNCESMNGPSVRRSVRLNEWNTWPCSITTTAAPRAQSRKVRRLLVSRLLSCAVRFHALLTWIFDFHAGRQFQLQRVRLQGRIDLQVAIGHQTIIARRLENFFPQRIWIAFSRNPQFQLLNILPGVGASLGINCR